MCFNLIEVIVVIYFIKMGEIWTKMPMSSEELRGQDGPRWRLARVGCASISLRRVHSHECQARRPGPRSRPQASPEVTEVPSHETWIERVVARSHVTYKVLINPTDSVRAGCTARRVRFSSGAEGPGPERSSAHARTRVQLLHSHFISHSR